MVLSLKDATQYDFIAVEDVYGSVFSGMRQVG